MLFSKSCVSDAFRWLRRIMLVGCGVAAFGQDGKKSGWRIALQWGSSGTETRPRRYIRRVPQGDIQDKNRVSSEFSKTFIVVGILEYKYICDSGGIWPSFGKNNPSGTAEASSELRGCCHTTDGYLGVLVGSDATSPRRNLTL